MTACFQVVSSSTIILPFDTIVCDAESIIKYSVKKKMSN
jgi:hypothetical protein